MEEGVAMNIQESKSLIYQGEKVDIECKKADGNVPKSVYESYSAFANTKGGYIILGVIEDKTKLFWRNVLLFEELKILRLKKRTFGIPSMVIK